MANIINKLLLDDKEYNSKLDKARRSTQNYKSDVDNLDKSVGNALVKSFGSLASILGVAGGAIGTFDKLIKSSQTTSDQWDVTIRAAKSSVDTFFTALSTGDFSPFLGGLQNIIDRAKQAAVALDALGNAQMSYAYFTTANQAEFAEAITVMRDQNASYADKSAAKKTAEAVLGDQQEIVTVLHQKITDTVQSVMSESNYLTSSQIERADLTKILRLDISANGKEEKKRLAAEYQQYLKELSEIPAIQRTAGYVQTGRMNRRTGAPELKYVEASTPEEIEAHDRALSAISDKYKDAVLYNTILVNKSNEWLQNLIQMTNQMDSADKLLADMQKQLNRAGNIVEPIEVPVKVQQPDLSGIEAAGITIPAVIKVHIPKKIEMPQPPTTEIDSINDSLYETSRASEDINDVMTETGNIANDTTSALETMFAAMSSLGGAIDNTAGSWLQWGANVLRAIAQAVPALASLTATENAAATASSAKAVAGGAGAVANIPYVGPALAIAAAASITAAIAAAPKFATGGVVPGVSFSGDNVLARVNSQEMVLTREQQTILSDRLNGDNLGGRVEFVIRDSQLVGVLESYNRKISRTV